MNIITKLIKSRFIHFGIVGFAGTLTNLSIFFLCVDILKFNPIFISIIAFLIAATQNYILNHKWTFKFEVKNKNLSLNTYLKFILSSLIGLVVNLIILKTILSLYPLHLKVIAQAIGILGGMIINFLFSKFYVFK